MMEDTPGTMDLDTWGPPDHTLQGGTKAVALGAMMTHPVLMGLTTRVLVDLRVVDHLFTMCQRGLTAPTCLMVQLEAEMVWGDLMVHLTLRALEGLMVQLVSSPQSGLRDKDLDRATLRALCSALTTWLLVLDPDKWASSSSGLYASMAHQTRWAR